MAGKSRPSPCYLDNAVSLGNRGGRKIWRSQDGKRYYTWDSLHGEIEVFDTGHANGRRLPSTAEALFAVLQERFHKEAALSSIRSHPDFNLYLAKRATEIIAKRLSRTP